MGRKTTAADAANTTDVAALSDTADTTVEPMQNITDTAAADAASSTVTASTADGTVEVSAERLALAKIDGALASMPEGHAARPALVARRVAALAAVEASDAAAAIAAERASEESDARNTAAEFGLDADVLTEMLAAIEAKYAPVADPTPDAIAAIVEFGRRRGPSERTISANADAAADTTYAARAADAAAAFDKDSGALSCNVHARPNTRYSGMLALAPSSTGVANYADYDRLTRAIRHHLVTVKRWPVSDSDGQSVPEHKWLAARGRYVIGGGVKSAIDCFRSRAELALYADGRFRWALPNTPNVRWLRTDNAAYALFVGGTAPAAPAAPVTAPRQTPTPPTPPTPPTGGEAASGTAQSDTLPQGSLTTTARCVSCASRNVTTAAECVNCGETAWLAD
jgi:hypothetical protein